MREILFRGKRVDNGEWVYGFPFAIHAGLVVEGIETWDGDRPRIDPETVGQYTGLTDKNGKRIFEGDVVAYPEYGNLAVVWDDGLFQLAKNETFYERLDHYSSAAAIIIGNIHDNPELLEAPDGGPED